MRAKEFLAELADRPYPFDIAVQRAEESRYGFTTESGDEYLVLVKPVNSGSSFQPDILQVDFAKREAGGPIDNEYTDVKTGTSGKESLRIFSTVFAAMKDSLASRIKGGLPIDQIRFAARDIEPSRVALYRRFARSVGRYLPGWEFNGERTVNDSTAFFIAKQLPRVKIPAIHETELDEVNMDGRKGAGAVPFNADVDYFGLRVKVQPLRWLSMALELTVDPPTEDRINGLADYIKQGGAIGQPWFNIAIPPEWDDGDFSKPAKIMGHEGRHRMEAIFKAEGNAPVEVHLFPRGGLRARDFKPEWIQALNSHIINERGRLVQGPWFEAFK